MAALHGTVLLVVTNERVHDVRVLPEAARDVASHQRQCGTPWCDVDTRSSHPAWPQLAIWAPVPFTNVRSETEHLKASTQLVVCGGASNHHALGGQCTPAVHAAALISCALCTHQNTSTPKKTVPFTKRGPVLRLL